MTPIQIIGQPGAGKTTLMGELIAALTGIGLAVGSLKHSAHAHELDKPGKDSFIHREAGAVPAAMVTGKMAAIYLPKGPETNPRTLLENYFGHTDITLIEGWISGPHAKIEVWRSETGRDPLLMELSDEAGVKALVTDDALPDSVRRRMDALEILPISRQDLDGLVRFTRQQAAASEAPPKGLFKEIAMGLNYNWLKQVMSSRF